MSRQRDLIKDIINETREHPTAERVFELAKERMSTISLATIYNNLNVLTDKGEIRRLNTGEASVRYDNVRIEHDHAVCFYCGKVVDIFLGDKIKEVLSECGMDCHSYELTVKYTCEECKKNLS